ncbi:MAG TPA: TIGR01777 family oxidoreductase [Saprospiraceae bacterium]|nr:TIGR01777 family oxidoreductase [Saprospiraceae bacterium]
MKNKVVIFGGTGFLGRSLAEYLRARGWSPVLVARHQVKDLDFPFVAWDGRRVGPWKAALEGARAIVNLAGKSVNCQKTPENCDVILRSRVEATRAIGQALCEVEQKPKVWIQMSTAHIYGDPPEVHCSEGDTLGYGLAPFVGKAWEAAFASAKSEDIRGVVLRTSFVIGKGGGALPTLKALARWGLGGRVGHGRQGMSWIHETDLNRLILAAIERETFEGIYIASAPKPVSQATFMRKLRKKLRMPLALPAKAWMVKIGARFFLNTDPELILYGRYVYSERLREAGFAFTFPRLGEALDDLLN